MAGRAENPTPGRKENEMTRKKVTRPEEQAEILSQGVEQTQWSAKLTEVNLLYVAKKGKQEREQELLDFKYSETVVAIQNGRYGKCGCGEAIALDQLLDLQIFCEHCLEMQANHKKLLMDELAKKQTELHRISGISRKELPATSDCQYGNHPADYSASIPNIRLIQADNLRKQIRAIEELLHLVPFGKYGICQECYSAIPSARMRVSVFAKYCQPCGEEMHLKNPMRKIREIIY